MKRALAIAGLLTCCAIAFAAYPFIEMSGGKMLVTDGLIQFASGVAPPIVSDMIAHWKLNDDAANTTVADSFGGWDAAAQANTSGLTTNGKLGKAIMFNGSSDFIRTVSNVGHTGAVSFAFWINPGFTWSADTTQRPLVNWCDAASTTPRIYTRFEGTKRLYADVLAYSPGSDLYWNGAIVVSNATWGGVDYNPTAQYAAGDWIHVVLATSGRQGGSQIIVEPITLGAGAPEHAGKYLVGALDDVRVYGKKLTQADVDAIYNGGTGTEAE